MSSRALRVDAPAKINLHLLVGERRPDGYHELETVFQAISLCDTVEVALGGEAAAPAVALELEGPDLGPVEANLAYRAAVAFAERTGLREVVRVRLIKRIPAGAGLGGGSSDAAAVLLCLAELSGTDDRTLLHELGASLGADVPFFLGPGVTALGTGRGDELTWLPAEPTMSLVLALPPVHVSTAEAYTALAASRPQPGTRRASGHREASAGGGPVRPPHNDFADVVAPRHREIQASLEGLRAEGAEWALLSGSGAACFGVFTDAGSAERAATALQTRLGWTFVPASSLHARSAPRPIGG